MNQQLRVTQLFDCADFAKTLVTEARHEGKPWKLIQGPWTRGGTRAAYHRFRAEQAMAYLRTQVWHVNMGGRGKWARGIFARPYALTLHGTDIRENYWQEQHHAVLKADVDAAGKVWYATPDLQEKAEMVRADAEYLPIPVNVDDLPPWTPAAEPRVIFPSRWDASKGGDKLLGIAADVMRATSGRGVDVVGLDWGDRAAEARDLGIRLIPRMQKQQFLSEIAHAHVAVGQASGILATSELQAMGIGVPTIFADAVEGYPADVAAVCVDGADVGSAVQSALQDPAGLSMKLNCHDYIRRIHGPAVLLPRLEAGYAKTLENRL